MILSLSTREFRRASALMALVLIGGLAAGCGGGGVRAENASPQQVANRIDGVWSATLGQDRDGTRVPLTLVVDMAAPATAAEEGQAQPASRSNENGSRTFPVTGSIAETDIESGRLTIAPGLPPRLTFNTGPLSIERGDEVMQVQGPVTWDAEVGGPVDRLMLRGNATGADGVSGPWSATRN